MTKLAMRLVFEYEGIATPSASCGMARKDR
jgi:hypothetical protein